MTNRPSAVLRTDLPVCPVCGADKPRIIAYGLIRWMSDEALASFHASGYVVGGCVVDFGRNRECRLCQTRYLFASADELKGYADAR